jgi:hypothetical protein
MPVMNYALSTMGLLTNLVINAFTLTFALHFKNRTAKTVQP